MDTKTPTPLAQNQFSKYNISKLLLYENILCAICNLLSFFILLTILINGKIPSTISSLVAIIFILNITFSCLLFRNLIFARKVYHLPWQFNTIITLINAAFTLILQFFFLTIPGKIIAFAAYALIALFSLRRANFYLSYVHAQPKPNTTASNTPTPTFQQSLKERRSMTTYAFVYILINISFTINNLYWMIGAIQNIHVPGVGGMVPLVLLCVQWPCAGISLTFIVSARQNIRELQKREENLHQSFRRFINYYKISIITSSIPIIITITTMIAIFLV